MLRTLSANAFADTAKVKCGEIFCQSSNSFTIICTYCEFKCFDFKDFLLHFKNTHFENDLIKTITKTATIISTVAAEALNKVVATQAVKSESAGCSNVELYNLDSNYENLSSEENEINDEMKTMNIKKDNSVIKIVNWKMCEPQRKTARRKQQHKEQKINDDISFNELVEYAPDESQGDDENEAVDDEDYKPLMQVPKTHNQTDEYKCTICDKSYHSKGFYTLHLKREHDYAEKLKCDACNFQICGQRQLDLHMVNAHGGIQCNHCNKRYKSRRELLRHEIYHTGERNVPCDFEGCNKRFFHKRNMHTHRKIHSLFKNYICENCGYSCHNKETLRIHARRHTGERPYPCKVCHKSFPSHSRLREHEAMHSSTRPYVCAECGATFSRQKGLYHHKFLHYDEKQFVCNVCGKAYAQAAGLSGHMRKHKGENLRCQF